MTNLLESEDRDYPFTYDEISFMLTPGIRSVRGGKKIIDYVDDKEVRKYIELTFVQMFQDVDHPNINKRGMRYRYMRVKKCDYTDYQMNEQTKKLYEFNDRRQRLYYCPDISDGLRRVDEKEGERKSVRDLHI